MNALRCRCLAYAFVALAAATSAPAAADVLALPGVDQCSIVAVQMLDQVNSADALPGDFFRFETINAVTAGKRIAVPARTIGYGVVAVASHAGRSGQAGTLVLEPRYLQLPGGVHLGVVLDHYASDLQRNGRSGNMPGILGAIPGLGAAIGIFNFFHHGRDIVVKKGTIFSIFPAEGPKTEKCQVAPDL